MPRNLEEVSHRFLYPFNLQVKLIGLLLRSSKFSSPPRANNVDTFPSLMRLSVFGLVLV